MHQKTLDALHLSMAVVNWEEARKDQGDNGGEEMSWRRLQGIASIEM